MMNTAANSVGTDREFPSSLEENRLVPPPEPLNPTLTDPGDGGSVPSMSAGSQSPVAPSQNLGDATNGTEPVRSQPLSTLRPGDRLGKYQIVDVPGRGGMGIVFKARDPILDRTVAIKVLGPLLEDRSGARQRFMREGRSAAAVKDPHVVTVYGVEEHEGSPYLVLEYVEGSSLEKLLAKSAPLPVSDVVDLGTRVARGLAAAHKKGLIHRDVKPANILLEDETGHAKLTDFGLARAADDSSISRNGEVCGTPDYMAPEQVAGGPIDHRADLFSLGGVLYCMCTGSPPFAAMNPMAVLCRVTTASPEPLRDRNPDVPPWLAELVNRLLAKDPDQRIQSAGEVIEVLTRRGASGPSDDDATVAVVSTAEARPPASGPAIGFWIVLVLGFLLSLPAFLLIRSSKPENRGPALDSERPVAQNSDLRAHDDKPAPLSEERAPDVPPPEAPTTTVRDATPPTPVPVPILPAGKPEREKKAPSESPRSVEGVVLLVLNDPGSLAYFREEGFSVRERNTSELVSLKPGRNTIPAGDYHFEHVDSHILVRVAPRHFTVSPERSLVLNVSHAPMIDPPLGPPPFPDPPPDRPGRRPPPPR